MTGADRVRRVLIVRVGAMGDVLHALPAVSALRAARPAWWIGWAVEPRWEPLLRAEGLVDRVHLVPVRAWKERGVWRQTLREILALRRELRAERYDVCVDLQGSVRSAVIGWMAGADRFVGSSAPREWPANVLYSERKTLLGEHVIGQACELAGEAAGMALQPSKTFLPIDGAATQRVEARLESVTGRFVFLVPGEGWGAKQWPVERYRELAGRLREAGFGVLVNASSARDVLANQVDREGVFACDLPELMAVVRRADLVIGGDTGPVHLAAALGVPVLALFGPTDPARTGPQGFPGSGTRVLRHSSSSTSHKRYAETEAGLAKIPVEEVAAAALAMLAEAGGGRG